MRVLTPPGGTPPPGPPDHPLIDLLTDLNLLLGFYGVTGEQAGWLRELARAGRQRGRWSGYRTAIPEWRP